MAISRKTMGVRSATFVVGVAMLMLMTTPTTNLQFVEGNKVIEVILKVFLIMMLYCIVLYCFQQMTHLSLSLQ